MSPKNYPLTFVIHSMKRKYNLKIERKKHIPSHLFLQPKSVPVPKSSLPKFVDLRRNWTDVYDQGEIGSCTANALCSVLVKDNPKLVPSRLFLYYNERILDGDVDEDSGSTLTQGINALVHYGICAEGYWPYDTSRVLSAPTQKAYKNGRLTRISGYQHVVQDLAHMKAALAGNTPFVVGIQVYSSFESMTTASTGSVRYPDVGNEEYLGGHALLVVGYYDRTEMFIVRNSWGRDWGDKGYCYIPYRYLLDTELTSDLWCIKQCATTR